MKVLKTISRDAWLNQSTYFRYRTIHSRNRRKLLPAFSPSHSRRSNASVAEKETGKSGESEMLSAGGLATTQRCRAGKKDRPPKKKRDVQPDGTWGKKTEMTFAASSAATPTEVWGKTQIEMLPAWLPSYCSLDSPALSNSISAVEIEPVVASPRLSSSAKSGFGEVSEELLRPTARAAVHQYQMNEISETLSNDYQESNAPLLKT